MLETPNLWEVRMIRSLKTILLLLPLLVSQAAVAAPLYQWTGSDGTPTYSPDPPPKGVPFTLVGADLQPLPANTATPQSALAPTAPRAPAPAAVANSDATAALRQLQKRSRDVVMTPPPTTIQTTAPKTKWKPVKYADDPNPTMNKPTFNSRANSAEVDPPIGLVSAECLDVKQKLLLLESQFASAASAKEMDSAVLLLSAFRKNNKGLCGL